MKDYYETLELDRNCDLQEVRKNFHRLALRWHPDKCLNKIEAETRFNEIHEAYRILNDPRKKEIYDAYGHAGLRFEEECNENPNPNRGTSFFEKGFQGTEKSAFDVLKDILLENNDDYFFQNYENFGISDAFQATFKSFIEDNVFASKTDTEDNFFENYQPTFMDKNFFLSPPEFPEIDLSNSYTTHVFTFQSTNDGDQTYTRTSQTIFQNEKVSTSTKDKFQNGNKKTEKGNFKEYTSSTTNDNNVFCNLDSNFSSKLQDGTFIVFEDTTFNLYNENTDFFNLDEVNKMYDDQLNKKGKLNSPSKKITKNKESLTNIRLTNKKPSKKNRS